MEGDQADSGKNEVGTALLQDWPQQWLQLRANVGGHVCMCGVRNNMRRKSWRREQQRRRQQRQ